MTTIILQLPLPLLAAAWAAGKQPWPAWLTPVLCGLAGCCVLFVAGIAYLWRQGRAQTRSLRDEVSEARKIRDNLQESRRQQEQLLEAARQVTESLDIRDVLTRIAAAAQEILQSYGCAIYLLKPDGRTLRPVVSLDPYDSEILNVPLDIDGSFTGQAIIARRGLIFNDAWEDASGHWIAGTPEETEERVMVAPLIVDGEALGAVTLNRIGTLFTPEDLALAETFAVYAGLALKNAQAYDALQREVEERRRVEDALRTSEEKFSIAFRSSPGAISISSLEDGRLIDVNDSFVQMTGYSRDEVIGQSVDDLHLWAGEEPYSHLMDRLRERGKITNYDYPFRRQSGAPGDGLFSAEVVELAGELCALGVISDITGRNRLQAQLMQAQKLEAVGRLAGGVAHDFNNLLTAIIGNAELFLLGADTDTLGYQEVQVIRRTARRAAELTRQLLTLSRRQVMDPAPLNLNNVIKGMSEMFPRLVGEDIRYELALDPNLRLVAADLSQMEQVVLNLVINAREAMPDGGALQIVTENVTLDEGQLYTEVKPGEYVCLSVVDSGVGMTPAIQEHIWEPFFTTKANGTGLGLATVYGIVKQFGGHVATHSQVARGTTFEIYLPVIDRPDRAPPPQIDEQVADLPTGDSTILLVEDEFEIRELAHSVLTGLGYTVLAARSGEDALVRAEQHPGRIDLILSDIVLPDIDGGELVQRLRNRQPDVKVLFTSGYADDRIANADIDTGKAGPRAPAGAGFLEKPFSPQTLARMVRTALGGPHATKGEG